MAGMEQDHPQPPDPEQIHQPDVALRRHYPMAFRVVILRCFPWLVLFLILVLVLNYFDRLSAQAEYDGARQTFALFGTALFFTALIPLLAKILYEIAYFLLADYRIKDQQLIIRKGVLWRTTAAYPVSKLIGLYIERSPIELLFFLAKLQIGTAAGSGVQPSGIGAIEGLSGRTAQALQAYLANLSSTTQPVVPPAAAESLLHQFPADESEKSRQLESTDKAEKFQRDARHAEEVQQQRFNRATG